MRELENTSLSLPLALTKELTNQFGNVTRVARIVVGKIETHIDSINKTEFENQSILAFGACKTEQTLNTANPIARWVEFVEGCFDYRAMTVMFEVVLSSRVAAEFA